MTRATSRSLPDVPDILHHVFSYLDPIHQSGDGQAYESRLSLAFAARTCHGFTGPALDVLWKRLPDDQPLADLLCELGIATREGVQEDFGHLGQKKPGRYCLPYKGGGGYRLAGVAEAYEKHWRLSRGYDLKYVLQTTDDPRTHPNWPRFVEYASRVRAITLFVFDGPAWSAIWEELLAVTDRAPILPRLLSVAFCHFTPQTINRGAFALISPSVHNLNLSISSDVWFQRNEKFRSIFTQNFSAALEIEKLRIDFPPYTVGESLLQTHCSQLLHLEISPLLDLDGLRSLTALPALQHLSISLSREDFPEINPSFTFESITTLVVEGTWTNLSTLLDTIRLPSMHMLSVTGWEHGDPVTELVKAATQCFRTLASRHPSITSLSVSATHGRVPSSRGCIVFGIPLIEDAFPASLLDIVHPLLALTTLHRLELGFPSYFDIACTETDLRAIAEAFPALETFHLRVWPYFGFALRDGSNNDPPERVRGGQLEALRYFARNCPRLQVLHLPAMEMTEWTLTLAESLGDRQPQSRELHGLRTLVIPRVLLPAGRVDIAGRVSEVVRGVFPLAVSPFRLERLTMEEDWAVADGDSKCPECARGSGLTFAFNPYADPK
ncbi:hypothetical protein GSI_11543 [Ganoderma sinense ZZ0214-1]|uniref:Uncharacterized protein n=1 Tax=Ganoderma sinense ZZ0214-1 TaxID=1077348 RepID=A0A2G8RWA5_9APHY|nr:hypothetical protein GSI_11543 [Ganoderma sinense ZZ0214-1]